MRTTETIIGKKGLLAVEGLVIQVTVLEQRNAYGRLDALVTPTHNGGLDNCQWVNSERVRWLP